MKTTLLVLIGMSCIVTSGNLLVQSPGNVATDLVLWLKPSSFTAATWTDLSTTGNDFTQGVANRQAAVSSNLMNYNSAIRFDDPDGQRDYMDGSRILNDGTTDFSFFLAAEDQGSADWSPIIEFQLDWNSRFELQTPGTNIRFGAPHCTISGAGASSPNLGLSSRPMVGSVIGQTVDLTGEMDGSAGTAAANSEMHALTTSSRISSRVRGPLRADLGDIIVYDNDLSETNQHKIETYLGIKYGTTLVHDYLSTTGGTIYDVSTYNTDIIGIGRDDNTTQSQKQSHSFDDSLRVYISTLETSNTANTGTFTSDVSYVVTGHDEGQLCATGVSLTEIPAGCGLYSRIEREWKVTKTDFTQNYNSDFTLNGCAVLGSITADDLRFMVDDNGDFSDGGTTCYANGDGSGIVITYSDPVITISNISGTHIPNNSTRYVTIASVFGGTPLPIQMTEFTATPENQTVLLDWTTSSEMNNDYFTVQRSRDALSWNSIMTVEGAGNTSETTHYNQIDYNPYPGTSYYRIKQTDFDGESSYSHVETVNFGLPDDVELIIYPNPTTNEIILSGSAQELSTVKIYNLVGQEITADLIENESVRKRFDVSNLSPGVYLIHTESVITRIVKQ